MLTAVRWSKEDSQTSACVRDAKKSCVLVIKLFSQKFDPQKFDPQKFDTQKSARKKFLPSSAHRSVSEVASFSSKHFSLAVEQLNLVQTFAGLQYGIYLDDSHFIVYSNAPQRTSQVPRSLLCSSFARGLPREFRRIIFPDCTLHPHSSLSSTVADYHTGITSSKRQSMASKTKLCMECAIAGSVVKCEI
jgi:hypothetical protein